MTGTTSDTAEIFERGYRSYDGPRTGALGAMRSIWIASVQRALGLRRKFRFKIVPILAAALAYLPAIAFLGFAMLVPNDVLGEIGGADYAGYFGQISISLALFTAFVAPELLSTDRQTGMLGLYLSGPITRLQYLVSKAGALLAVMLIVTMFPVLFMLAGYMTLGLGPGGVGDTLTIVVKIMITGVLTALYFALIGMAISTLTNRKGFASAGIVVFLLASAALSGILVEAAGAPDWVQLFGFIGLPFEIASRVFNETEEQIANVSAAASWSVFIGVGVVSLAVIAWGYRRLEVTK